MKRAILILILISLCLSVWAQCPTGNITFTTQQQVDDFAVNYPNCTEISGNLTFDEINNWADIISLNSLNQITSVGGSMEFRGTSLLNSLSGLENLTSIGENLTLNLCYELDSFEGLNNLTSIGGGVSLNNGGDWTDLRGLESLTTIGNNFRVFNCNQVVNFEGLNALVVNGDLYIRSNNDLTDLRGLNNVTFLGSSIEIKENFSLSLCHVEGICNYLLTGNPANIVANAPGCGSPAEIEAACMSIPGCPLDDVMLSTQQQVDDFAVNYPDCTEVLGDFKIGGTYNTPSSISDLSPLNQLTYIGGDLEIVYNDALTDLSGLENINQVGGDLSIHSNTVLSSLTGLDSLSHIGGSFVTFANDVLTDLTGLEGLTSVGGEFTISTGALTSLTGLNNLTTIGDQLYIGNTQSLTSLTGLERLTAIGSAYIYNNYGFSDLTGLENLTTVQGDFSIDICWGLNSLEGLESISTIGGVLSLNETPGLSFCSVPAICDYLQDGGAAYLNGNAYGCNSTAEIQIACVSGNVCPDSHVGLSSQQQVDDFPLIYPNCTEIVGNLIISGQVVDLSPLSQLTSVGGDLMIFGSQSLVDLSGLENLTSVEGALLITDNAILDDLSGLDNLASVGGHVSVFGNDILRSLSGLNSLASIGSYMQIENNSGLEDLAGLVSLTSIPSYLKIQNNYLTDLSGLSGLTSIGGSLKIRRIYAQTLSGLDNLTSLGGNLQILKNPNLADISSLENVDYTAISTLNIIDNPQLSSCSISNFCDYLGNGGTANIYSNDPGCNSPVEVENACITVSQCPPGDVLIASQAEMDNFAVLYPNCTEIMGDLSIGSSISFTDISDLSSLGQLTSVEGSLYIMQNTNLTDLSDLSNLIYIGGTDLVIYDNNALPNLNGFEGLTSLDGTLRIAHNDNLVNLSGLQNLTSVGSYMLIQGSRLNDLSGLNSLTSIGGYLRIQANSQLQSLDGLDNLASIGGYLHFENNATNNSSALAGLTSLGGHLEIKDGGLGDVSGFSSLTSLGGYLEIRNTNLVNLSGFDGITAIGGNLRLINNDDLIDISGLENINYNTISDLRITYNPELSFCNLSNFCDYLENGGTANILANASGCNSQAEVEAACMSATDCPTGDITFNTQQEIDDFPINYPECTTIFGNLTIGGFPFGAIDNLEALSQITEIQGNLTIEENWVVGLQSLSGLENITSIAGELNINNNYDLTSLQGIENIDPTTITNLVISSNDLISVCDLPFICDYLESGGSATINSNASGCNSKAEVEAACNPVDIICPDNFWPLSQQDVDDFPVNYPGCTEIPGNLYITIDLIENLDGLSQITAVGGDLTIDTFVPNEQFAVDISGLQNITTVGGNLKIRTDYYWTNPSLDAFQNLTSIGGNLEMNDNGFTDLSPLQNLTNVGGIVAIHSEYYLTSLEGLENIEYANIAELQIYENPNLSVCNLPSICTYLENGGIADISFNATGCDSQLEVEALCGSPCTGGSTSTDSITHIFDEDLFVDGVGFDNNPSIIFPHAATSGDIGLSDISLELYFRLNGNSCENEIAVQITDPTGTTHPLTAYTTCDGGTGLYYVNLEVPSVNTPVGTEDWIVEFDDTNDQNTDYEYSVRFARLNYVVTTGPDLPYVNQVSEIADMDLFIDGVGFENNPSVTFTDPGTPAGAELSDISLELYFRLNGNSCENEIAIQITDPAGNTQALTAYTSCDGGTSLYYVNLEVPSGSTTGSVADWLVEFDDTNDQNADYEYSVRFGRLTYTTTSGGYNPIVITDEVVTTADMDLFIDGVGFDNNPTYSFHDPTTPAIAELSDIQLELYFRLNGTSCENEIALQITDPTGNTHPLTAYTTCDGGTGLYYVNLDVPSGHVTDNYYDYWVVEFDDTNDQNSDYEYSVRFGRLTYNIEYDLCEAEMMIVEENDESQQSNTQPAQQRTNHDTTTPQDHNTIKLYPVPANQHLNVEYISENANSANIEILSNEGKMMMSQEAFLQEGINTIQLEIADLPAGHYHLRMYNADNMQMQSFVKITP